jgi:pimeloyl-ACP methyl ester carboxylesterase
MKDTAKLYSGYLLNGESPAEIFRRKPKLAALWDDQGYAHQYGRPIAFYQQLQELNLADAWSRVNVPTLAVHGEYDWIMSRDDHELIAAMVNKNRPGAAQFMEVPQMGHGFQHFTSWPDAFAFRESQFDPSVIQLLVKWFEQHR